jgi:hypothetical protein
MAVVGFPERAGDSYEFRLYGNDGNPNTYDLASVFVDPYSDRIPREGPSTRLAGSLLNWLMQFHFCFQLGMYDVCPARPSNASLTTRERNSIRQALKGGINPARSVPVA